MSTRKKFEDKIFKLESEISVKRQEIDDLTAQLRAWQDALKLLPKETPDILIPSFTEFRAGSDMAKVENILKENGRPMYIDEIMEKLGRENSKTNRVSISSQIQAYVRKGQNFIKTKPNTFGLIGMEAKKEPPEGGSVSDTGAV